MQWLNIGIYHLVLLDEKTQPIVMNTAKQPVHQKGGSRREHKGETTESAPLVHTHATTTV